MGDSMIWLEAMSTVSHQYFEAHVVADVTRRSESGLSKKGKDKDRPRRALKRRGRGRPLSDRRPSESKFPAFSVEISDNV